MESIFESLDMNVSEGCFQDILNIVEEIINEVSDEWKQSCKDKAADIKARFRQKYDEAQDAYRRERSSKNGDNVLDAVARCDKAEKREDKLLKAIEKHDKAKAEGKIKPAKKEDKDDSNK